MNGKVSGKPAQVTLQVDEDVELPEQDVAKLKSFTDLLSRGRLVCPSHMNVCFTKDACHVYRWLLKKGTRYTLFGCTNPKEAFQKVIVALGEGDDQLATLSCASGHNFLKMLYSKMAGTLFNAFTSNYSKERNSAVQYKRKIDNSRVARINSTDKRKKLNGSKK